MIWKLFFFQQLHAKRGDRKREREWEKNYVVGVIACFAQKRALSLLKGFFFSYGKKKEREFFIVTINGREEPCTFLKYP